ASANQPVDTRPGKPASAVVGISGNTGERRGSGIAKIFTPPTREGGPPPAEFPKKTATWAPVLSVSTSVSPREGTGPMLGAVLPWNIMAVRWGVAPLPWVPKVTFPGFALP